MNHRERIWTIIDGGAPDRSGFWLGNPHPESWEIYLEAFGQESGEDVRRLLGDDFRWICPQWSSYRHPEGKPLWDVRPKADTLGCGGVFADCEDASEVDDFEWPDPDHLDFSEVLAELRAAGDVYRASGFWCPFFHDLADFIGMESYFVRMLTHPEVVHAITRRIVDFYLEANRRFFTQAGDLVDGFFLGNDFGSQLDLLVGPRQFDEFVGSYFREFVAQGKEHGHQVILHSCGAIHRVIPTLIEMGVDALHPLQARARDMDAETLACDFKGQVAFVGGVDTQDLLVNGTPDDVRADVRRVKELLGPNLVVSPSHEALLPNVSPENVRAMAEAAVE